MSCSLGRCLQWIVQYRSWGKTRRNPFTDALLHLRRQSRADSKRIRHWLLCPRLLPLYTFIRRWYVSHRAISKRSATSSEVNRKFLRHMGYHVKSKKVKKHAVREESGYPALSSTWWKWSGVGQLMDVSWRDLVMTQGIQLLYQSETKKLIQ